MNYEKAYKEALERAKESLKDGTISSNTISYIEEIFPELKESEDDRIRKALIKYYSFDKDGGSHALDNITPKQIVTWLEKQGELVKINPTEFDTRLQALIGKFGSLPKEELIGSLSFWTNVVQNDGTYTEEKQGEQKPTNEVEPKFHEGEWVVQGDNILKIKCVGDTHYCFETVRGYVDDMLVSEIDSLYHLWTIQDAKKGDVLSDETTIFIFKDLLSDGSVMSYCDYDTDSGESDAFCPLSMNLMCSKITTATKEQRNILMKAMADAGYTFDFEKKELKKIEQKPADKSKFKVKYAGSEYNVFETKDIAGVTFYGIEDEPNHIDYVKADNCEIISGYGIKESGLSFPTKPVMFSEKKPAWSEEDEKEVAVLEAYIRSKDWSERHIDRALGIVDELVNKVKSTRPQKQWKPNIEQLEALWCATEKYIESDNEQVRKLRGEVLESLYNDLKKLTE